MKKILIILSLFLLSISAEAQFILSRNNYVPPAVTGGGDPPASEMISNGTFTTDADWTYNPLDFTIGGGVCDKIAAGGGCDLNQLGTDMLGTILVNTDYRCTIVVSAGIEVIIGNGSQFYTGYVNLTAGSNTLDFTTPASISNTNIKFIFGAGLDDITSISLVEN